MMPFQALPKASHRPDGRPAAAPGERATSRGTGRARLRILVVDEPGIMREGLCALLAGMPDIDVVGSTAIGLEALRGALSLQAEMIILELPHEARGGPRLIATIKSQLPEVRLIVLTFHREEPIVEAVLRAGADGFVLKSDSREVLFSAVVNVAAGKLSISPTLRGHRARGELAAARDAARAGAATLTEREQQVIRLIAAGHRTREIAKLLSLSHKTIEKHRTSLMRKLGLRNATAVAAYAIVNGFADD